MPTQSLPVSPPPTTITSLSLAAPIGRRLKRPGGRGKVVHRKLHTRSSRPGTLRSRADRRLRRAPPRRSPFLSSLSVISCPRPCLRQTSRPRPSSGVNAALHHRFFQLHVGDAVHEKSSGAVALFQTRSRCGPAVELGGCRQACRAAHHRHRLPVRFWGRVGTISLRAKASSMTQSSLAFYGDRVPVEPAGAGASHRAGHTRPVNSGKSLVLSRRSRARWHCHR